MYLKNNSKFQVGLRTKKEVLTIKPGEAVQVFESDIINMNTKLVVISESEYESLNKIVIPTKTVDIFVKEDILPEGNSIEPVEDKQEIIEEDNKEFKTEDTEETIIEEITVDNTKKNKDLKDLTRDELLEKLEELKIKWQNTLDAKKKETLAKEIKKINKKLK